MKTIDVVLTLILNIPIILGIISLLIYRRKIILAFHIDIWTFFQIISGILIPLIAVSLAFSVYWVFGLINIHNVHFDTLMFFNTLKGFTIAALFEELIFRAGLLIGLIHLTKNTWLAIILSSVCFGLVHSFNPGATLLSVISNTIGGIMYSLAFLQSGRIWMALSLHISWNFLQAFYGFLVSGMSIGKSMFITQTPRGLVFFTGGTYGFEGGIIGIGARMVIITLIFLTIKYFSQQTSQIQKNVEAILSPNLQKTSNSA